MDKTSVVVPKALNFEDPLKPLKSGPALLQASSVTNQFEDMLQSATAKSLASATTVPEVLLSTTIFDVMHILEKGGTSCIVVRDFETHQKSRDIVFRRIDIFNVSMKLKCYEKPLSHIIDHLPRVHQVDGEDSLLAVVHAMQASGSEEIGIYDSAQGVVRGVVTCKAVMSFIRHHEPAHIAQRRASDLGGAGRFEHIEEEEEEQMLNRTEKENRNRENVGPGRFTPAQLVAQVRAHLSLPNPPSLGFGPPIGVREGEMVRERERQGRRRSGPRHGDRETERW
jgi:hypothetical protein